jgi:hypothetical protein
MVARKLAIVSGGIRRALDDAKKCAQVNPAFKICKVTWTTNSHPLSHGGAAALRQILLI